MVPCVTALRLSSRTWEDPANCAYKQRAGPANCTAGELYHAQDCSPSSNEGWPHKYLPPINAIGAGLYRPGLVKSGPHGHD